MLRHNSMSIVWQCNIGCIRAYGHALLQVMDCIDCGLTDACCATIQKWLVHATQIQELDLHGLL